MLAVSIYISRGDGGLHWLHWVLKVAPQTASLFLGTLELSFISLFVLLHSCVGPAGWGPLPRSALPHAVK